MNSFIGIFQGFYLDLQQDPAPPPLNTCEYLNSSEYLWETLTCNSICLVFSID